MIGYKIAELRESWINGNLSYVTDIVANMDRSEILDLVIYMIENRTDSELLDDLESLKGMLENRNR